MSLEERPAYAADDFLKDDLRRCDLVMKGGVASGLVYPPAIVELATRYRFVSIGGTSAGAIAAVAAAAAEHGRRVPYAGYTTGYERLERLRAWLGEREGNLLELFQPSPQAAPLYHTLLDLAIERRTAKPQRPSAPQPPAPLLLRILMAMARFAWAALSLVARAAGLLLRHNTRVVLLGALATLAVVALVWLAWSAVAGTPLVGAGLAGRALLWLTVSLAVGLTVGLVNLFWTAAVELPRSNFGMCSGHQPGAQPIGWPPTLGDERGGGSAPALADWLHAVVNGLAGRPADAPPLTFGELAAPAGGGEGVTLRMVTSNLTENMPYVLPKDLRKFLFDPDELAGLFPEPVVRLLRERSPGPAYRARTAPGVERTLLPLPAWADLPAVLGARLSLSFPLLIAAIPLYTVSRAGEAQLERARVLGPEHVQRHLFSDGGIASNFPIHFFDRWLPTHPTFGINLVAMPETAIEEDELLGQLLAQEPGAGVAQRAVVKSANLSRADFDAAAPEASQAARAERLLRPAGPFADPAGEVYLPPAGPGDDYIEFKQVGSLPAFVWAIFSTAQNYRDTAQARLPGYNERVVRVRLREEEGGLNLRMSPAQIAEIVRKGRLAGRALLPTEPEAQNRRRGGFRFDDHRWVRLVVLLTEIDQQLRDMRTAYDDQGADYAAFLAAALGDDELPACPPYYAGTAEERALFARRIEALIALYTLWSDLDVETTARLNRVLLRLDRRALADLAQLLEAPDDAAALAGLRRWVGELHREQLRAAKGPAAPDARDDMIELRVTPTI